MTSFIYRNFPNELGYNNLQKLAISFAFYERTDRKCRCFDQFWHFSTYNFLYKHRIEKFSEQKLLISSRRSVWYRCWLVFMPLDDFRKSIKKLPVNASKCQWMRITSSSAVSREKLPMNSDNCRSVPVGKKVRTSATVGADRQFLRWDSEWWTEEWLHRTFWELGHLNVWIHLQWSPNRMSFFSKLKTPARCKKEIAGAYARGKRGNQCKLDSRSHASCFTRKPL